MNEEKVASALEAFRESLQADGADLKITNLSDDRLDLKIIANDKTCLDCLLPEETIHKIITKQLENNGVRFSEISLDYPAV